MTLLVCDVRELLLSARTVAEALRARNLSPNGRMGLARTNGLRLAGSQTLSAIIGNGAVDNGAAVDAFPCIEHEKEVREPLQHHHSLAFRTFH